MQDRPVQRIFRTVKRPPDEKMSERFMYTDNPSKEVAPVVRKPPAAGKGRVKGTPNKTTALLKDAIIKAAEATGDMGRDGLVGYCTFLAREEPKAFSVLLGKVLPMQVVGDASNPVVMITRRVIDTAGE